MADDRLSEGALIERLRAADGEALADLAVRYRPQLYDLALRHLRCPEEAEEVVQDVLIKVCRRIRTFRGESALSTWIYRITFNHTMSRLRRKTLCAVPPWARGSGRASEGSGAERADLTPAPDEQLLRAELRQQVATAIRALPPAFRRVVVLRHLHELSIREVSRELRVNPSTVKSRLHRGRRMLRRALAALARGHGSTSSTPWCGSSAADCPARQAGRCRARDPNPARGGGVAGTIGWDLPARLYVDAGRKKDRQVPQGGDGRKDGRAKEGSGS